MKIQQVWASIIGLASFVIGTLRFFIPKLTETIPASDGVIHIITGAGFITGAWIANGKYASKTNFLLGVFYIIFGIIGFNWPHIIVGIISSIIGLTIKTTKTA